MADIVLKDKNGSPVYYNPVPAKISVQGHDNNNKETNFKYTRMAIMNCYAVKTVSEGYLLVTKEVVRIAFDDLWYTGFSENDLREYGSQSDDGTWGIGIIITAKRLTVGNTYAVSDMY